MIENVLLWLLPGFVGYELYRAASPAPRSTSDSRLFYYVMLSALASLAWDRPDAYDRYGQLYRPDLGEFLGSLAFLGALGLLFGAFRRVGAWRLDNHQSRVARGALAPAQGTEIRVHLQGGEALSGQAFLCERDHLVLRSPEHKTIAIPLERVLYWELPG